MLRYNDIQDYKYYYPHHVTFYSLYMQFIVPVIFSLITIYLGTGFFIYPLIIGFSLYCLGKGDRFLPLALFFILLYLLPYSLTEVVLGHNWGSYLDNNFLAGIPLYITLPLYFNRSSLLNKKLRIILTIFLIAFLVSTIIPGFLSFLGLGGYNVRFAWTLNYFNSFLAAVFAYSVFNSSINIDRFTNLIIFLGFFSAICGLLQYIFGPIFVNPDDVLENRLIIIPRTNAIALFPYFIVPFAFALNQMNSCDRRKKVFARITVFTLLLSSILTWSRWGIFVLLIMALIHIIISKKSLKLIISLSVVTFAILLIIQWIYYSTIIPVDQAKRISDITSLLTRITLWGMGLSLLSDVWLFGIGIGNTAKILFSYNPHEMLSDFYQIGFDAKTVQSIHHFFLDWFINQGIFAMLGLVGLYYYIIKHYRFIEKFFIDEIIRGFSRSIFLGLLGLSLFWMQNSGDQYYYLFLFLGSSFAIKKLILLYHMEELYKTNLSSPKHIT